ncbi:hypothetical protein MTO96_007945 [Rhipicephalus appendiculatus]
MTCTTPLVPWRPSLRRLKLKARSSPSPSRWRVVGPSCWRRRWSRSSRPARRGLPRRRFFGSYTEVCKTPPFSTNLLHEAQRYAMRAFDPGTRRMFVFDDEQSLCQKLCFAKANLTDVAFGVAVYDLDYEDTDDTCSNLNSMGPYSRLQIVSNVAKFLASQFTDPSRLAACFSIFRLAG